MLVLSTANRRALGLCEMLFFGPAATTATEASRQSSGTTPEP